MTGATASGPFLRTIPSAAPALVRAQRIPLGPCLAAALAGAYLARASLLAYVGSQWTTQLIAQLSMAALLAASAYIAASGVARLEWRGVLMIVAGAASLWHCETVGFALARWAGWALVLVAVGPVSNAPRARHFRRSTMETITWGVIAVTLLSAAWRVAGLPNLGCGDFTGVMWHSMTLAPLAALAGLMALARALSRGSLAWYAMFAVAVGVAMAASSRSALAGLAFGMMMQMALKIRRRPFLSAAALLAGLTVAMVPETSLGLISRVLPESLTAGLARKSWDHSREAHWDARWEEFLYSPLTGVGFATGWEDTAGSNEESGAVESGSSYLSILSMTGAMGAAAFLLAVLSAASRALKLRHRLSERQKLEITGLAGFWVVDFGAEGYVYGVGSLLGLTFWLWLARLLDQLDAAAQSSQTPARSLLRKGAA